MKLSMTMSDVTNTEMKQQERRIKLSQRKNFIGRTFSIYYKYCFKIINLNHLYLFSGFTFL